MAVRMTHLEFVNKLKNKYPKLYSKITIESEFKTSRDRILVNTKYGMCNPKAKSLLQGDFPSILVALDKTEYFIKRCIEIHGDLYDYSKTIYTTNKQNVDIICKKHGVFNIQASRHMDGVGCLHCSKENGVSINKKKKLKSNPITRQLFIEKLKSENPYMYNLISLDFEFKCISDKTIFHTKYGDIITTPRKLLDRKDLKAMIKNAVNKTEFFINLSKEVHGKKYTYEKTNYIGSNKNVIVTCPIHGDFYPQASHHLNGSNCKKCCIEDTSNIGVYGRKTAIRKKDLFEKIYAMLYVIQCESKDESFYKIGITKKDLYHRFDYKNNLPYEYRAIIEFKSNLYNVIMLEKELHQIHSDYKYKPNIYFGGHTECFYRIDLDKIKEVIDFG